MSDTADDRASHDYDVTPTTAGQRLDRWLADRTGVARAAIRRAIDQRRVFVDGGRASAGVALTAGQRVTLDGPTDDRASAPEPWQDAALAVIDGGEGWVAVDKPAGLPVHPLDTTQTRTALNAVVAMRPEVVGVGEGGLRSGVVHRLDVATSGVLLFATAQDAWQRFRAAFAEHRARKRYVALVHGGGVLPSETIRLRLAVRTHRPARVGVVRADQPGSDCSLRAAVTEERDGYALVEIDLHTGFLHQVRATLAYLGRPVVGDAVYGPAEPASSRLMLHAERLAIDAITLERPAPFGLVDVLDDVLDD